MTRGLSVRVTVPVCIAPDADGYHGFSPALKGCHIDGETVEEVRAALYDALVLYIQSLIRNDEPLPLGATGATMECGIPISNIELRRRARTQSENLDLLVPA